MVGNRDMSGKITLFTSQSMIVLDTIMEKGVYQVKRDYITKKYGESACIFLDVYNWFVREAEKIMPRPEGAEYPIWLFTEFKYAGMYDGCATLEVIADMDKVILFDREKWNRILNLSYIPCDKKDSREYKEYLHKQGIYDETDVYMKNYYPSLKARVIKSWGRLFDDNIILSQSRQAALWEIKKKQVANIIY